MQKNGQLHHFTYMILVLETKVIILHIKLSKLLNPCQVTCAFCFPFCSPSIKDHFTNVALSLICSQEYDYTRVHHPHAVH